jgi:hypothetical protein
VDGRRGGDGCCSGSDEGLGGEPDEATGTAGGSPGAGFTYSNSLIINGGGGGGGGYQHGGRSGGNGKQTSKEATSGRGGGAGGSWVTPNSGPPLVPSVDSAGLPAAGGSYDGKISIQPVGNGASPTISDPEGPLDGTVGSPYAATFPTTEDPVVMLGEGQLPPGLTLSLDGQLTGTPTKAGEYRFTLLAMNDVRRAGASLEVGLKIFAAPTQGKPPPDNHFRVLRPRARRDGTVTFTLKVPHSGTVDVLETASFNGPGRDGRLRCRPRGRIVFARKHLGVRAAGETRVTVAPDERGRALLAHHRSGVRICLRVSYTPAGGASAQHRYLRRAHPCPGRTHPPVSSPVRVAADPRARSSAPRRACVHGMACGGSAGT